jgi:hypothetical protein
MPDEPDDNVFSKTVKDAAKSRKVASPSSPPATSPTSNTAEQGAALSATTRTAETKALNVQVSAHKFDWVKATSSKNHWTNRTVIELALDALREKLGD